MPGAKKAGPSDVLGDEHGDAIALLDNKAMGWNQQHVTWAL